LKDVDIVKEAGFANRAIVKEVRGVKASQELTVALAPSALAPKSVAEGD
jgi:hypothetical protein